MKPFEESDRFNYALTPNSVVVDLGGYEGWFTDQARRKWDCYVICVEPVPEFFEICHRRFAGDPKVHVINAAVGDREGTAHIGVKGSMSGLFTKDMNSKAEARMMTPAALFEIVRAARGGDDTIDLLAMNIEGSEFDVLENMIRSGLISKVRNLQVQPHGVVDNAEERWRRIRRRLANTHDMIFCTDWCWEGYSPRK